jgi:hypothetical protein
MRTLPTVTLNFGDGPYPFSIYPIGAVRIIEDACRIGAGAVYERILSGQFYSSDMETVIRAGLIGGGMDPAEALRKCETYIQFMPWKAQCLLALAILMHRSSGIEDEKKEPVSESEAATPLTE